MQLLLHLHRYSHAMLLSLLSLFFLVHHRNGIFKARTFLHNIFTYRCSQFHDIPNPVCWNEYFHWALRWSIINGLMWTNFSFNPIRCVAYTIIPNKAQFFGHFVFTLFYKINIDNTDKFKALLIICYTKVEMLLPTKPQLYINFVKFSLLLLILHERTVHHMWTTRFLLLLFLLLF